MTRAEKFTAIYNAFKAIKTAIAGKGVTVSGDISTFADAVAAIPVGSEVVTGQVSGSGTKTLTITNAIGKNNIAVFLISTHYTSITPSDTTVIGAGFINGSKYMACKSSATSGGIINASYNSSYDKNTGKISYTGNASYYFSSSSYVKYVYVAW